MILNEEAIYNARFPAERWAHVTFVLRDGSRFTSKPAIARGNPENPLSDDELLEKYHRLAEPVLGRKRTLKLRGMVENLVTSSDTLAEFLDTLLLPPGAPYDC
jgi:2-methylcitrate dehydratase PrpD